METTNEFLRSIPHTPIYSHIGRIHSLVLYLYGQSAHGYGVKAVEMAEHSLREIAVASLSMLPPEDAWNEQMRWRHRVDPPPAPIMSENLGEAIRSAFKDMSEAVKNIGRPRTPEAQEAAAAREYRRMMRTQRATARAHLNKEVARVRKELGLNETGEQ
jgi:hypothetical protein